MTHPDASERARERRRRVTWWLHNVLVTPFIPVRIVMLAIIRLGEIIERVGLRTPGWRRYDGWSGW